MENDTSYACGKKKPIFPENRWPFPKNHHKERVQMSSNNNKLNVPQAKQAMEQFKMQAASDVDGPVTYWTIIESSKIIQINGWFPNLL